MQEKTIVISDTGPVISLGLLNLLEIFTKLFNEMYISDAVWKEIEQIQLISDIPEIKIFLKGKVKKITGENNLFPFADYGESEAILLCKEIKATYLVIDDKKAREIAESLGIKCIGTIGMLYKAKEKKIILELRPLFIKLIENKRYYPKSILNKILQKSKEKEI